MENITKIKIGEIFEVNNKLYVISQPDTPSGNTNEHNQIVFLLFPMD